MQTRNGALMGLAAGLLLPLLAIACSGGDESRDQASGSTATPFVTRLPQGASPPALQPVDRAGATPQAGPDATQEPISPAGSSNEPPITTARADGTVVEMGVGTYCWGNLCADKIGPVTRGTLEIASGAEIVVAVPAGPTLNTVNVTAFLAGVSLGVANGETAWQPDFDASVALTAQLAGDEVRIEGALPAGTYILTVGMFFESGDVQYGVVLEVR